MLQKFTNFVFKKAIPIFVGVLVVVCANRFINKFCHNDFKSATCAMENSYKKGINETPLAGIWVSYLDLQEFCKFNTEEEFKHSFENIVAECKKYQLNTLIVQVRPFADAMYPSKMFPWSHIVLGEQGCNPNFDPLKIMIDCSHSHNMKFHAWVNPFRISSVNNPQKLHNSNPCFCKELKNKTLNYNGMLIFNPAYEEVQTLVANGVKEIVENYDVDAIQFDDYFYPDGKEFDNIDIAKIDTAYQEYLKQESNLINYNDWCKIKINSLVKKTYDAIKSVNSNVKFGISPPGNIDRCNKIGADVNSWVNYSGYVDYICPQIYWSVDFKEMPFEKTAKSWRNLTQKSFVNLYVGLALYKVGSAHYDSGTWFKKSDIIPKEINISRNLNYNGFMLFSYKSLFHNFAKFNSESFKFD